jgi:hypothetical protein
VQVKQVKLLEQVKLSVAQMAGKKQAEEMSAAQVHAYNRVQTRTRTFISPENKTNKLKKC